MIKHTKLAMIAILIGLSTPALAHDHGVSKSIDPDRDGTVSLKEAQAAAAKHFKLIDTDKDGTIDKAEALAGGISEEEFALADKNKEGTLDRKELAEIVKNRFKAAQTDKDLTLDSKELKTPEGQQLMKLLQ
jgi:5-hydroxyisourate hydrolase-like protein (transthyretin family)